MRIRHVSVSFALAAMAALLAVPSSPAGATGTVRVQQRDGATKTYSDVRITMSEDYLTFASSDGHGTLAIGKGACTPSGYQLHCLLYDAPFDQFGQTTHIPLKSGTLWLNPSDAKQGFSYASMQLP